MKSTRSITAALRVVDKELIAVTPLFGADRRMYTGQGSGLHALTRREQPIQALPGILALYQDIWHIDGN